MVERQKKPPINLGDLIPEEEGPQPGPLNYAEKPEKEKSGSKGKTNGGGNLKAAAVAAFAALVFSVLAVMVLHPWGADVKTLEANQAELNGKLTSLQTLLSDSSVKLGNVIDSQGLYLKQGDLASLSESVSSLDSTISSLNSQLSDLRSQSKSFQQQIDGLQASLHSLSSDSSQVDELSASVSGLAGQVNSFQGTLASLKTEVTTLKDAFSATTTGTTPSGGTTTDIPNFTIDLSVVDEGSLQSDNSTIGEIKLSLKNGGTTDITDLQLGMYAFFDDCAAANQVISSTSYGTWSIRNQQKDEIDLRGRLGRIQAGETRRIYIDIQSWGTLAGSTGGRNATFLDSSSSDIEVIDWNG